MARANAYVLNKFVEVRKGGGKGSYWWFLVVDGLDYDVVLEKVEEVLDGVAVGGVVEPQLIYCTTCQKPPPAHQKWRGRMQSPSILRFLPILKIAIGEASPLDSLYIQIF